jgi:hypothetical protein
MPEIVILPALFLTLCFIVWISVTSWQRRQRLRLLIEFKTRLIDRLGSLNDFSEFAKTSGGAEFLNTMMAETPTAVRPGERILRATQSGVVLFTLGAGLLSLGYLQPSAREDFMIVGVVILSLGVGFLLASLASYRISLAMGLMPQQQTAK